MNQNHAKPAAVAAPETPLLREFPPLMGNRNFVLLWAAYAVSSLGDRIHFLVMLQLLCMIILKMNHLGSQQSAQLNLAMFIPMLLLSPIGGLLSDRMPRRAIMVACDLMRVALVIVARTVLLHGSKSGLYSTETMLVLLFGSEVVLALFAEIFLPARAALLPTLVHPNQLLQANSFVNGTGTIVSVAGFLVGGFLISHGLLVAMYADAGTYLASATFLLLMPLKGRDRVKAPGGGSSLKQDVRLGLGYLWRHIRPVQIILLEMLFYAMGSVILNSLPSIITEQFRKPSQWYSYFMGFSGLGMVLGALAVSRAKRGIPKEMGIAWSTVLIGAGLLVAALAGSWQMLLAGLLAASFFGAVMLISVDTLLQRIVPDFVRGRVMGIRDLACNIGLIGLCIPFAMGTSSPVFAHRLIMGAALATGAVGLFLVVLYYRVQPLPLPAAIARRICEIYITFWHRWRRVGACRIPGSGPVIVAGNHTSGLDPLAMGVSSPHRLIQFLMAREYYDLPVLKLLFRNLGCVPVDRSGADAGAVRASLRILKDGGVLGIFPEGGISPDGSLQAGKPGVGAMALITGATVVPVYIRGTHRHVSVGRDFLRRARLEIYYGTPISFAANREGSRDKTRQQQATDQIMAAIAAIRDRVENTPVGAA